MIGQRVQVQEVTDVEVRLTDRRLLQRVGTLLRLIRHNLENVKVTINRNVKVIFNRNVKVSVKVNINNSFMQLNFLIL